MTDPSDVPVNRLERRKQRTRAALIKAAQAFIAAGKVNVPVLEITQAADVGMGSFYNHFESKEQLFDAAVAEVLDAHGALLDQLDRVRSTTRPKRSPAASGSPAGCSAGARRRARSCSPTGWRCCRRNSASHRARCAISKPACGQAASTVDDPELALAVAGGALLGLGNLLRNQPDRDDATAADTVTEDVLRLFGLPADEARDICQRPLPDLESFELPDSAA